MTTGQPNDATRYGAALISCWLALRGAKLSRAPTGLSFKLWLLEYRVIVAIPPVGIAAMRSLVPPTIDAVRACRRNRNRSQSTQPQFFKLRTQAAALASALP